MDAVRFADRYEITGSVRQGRFCTELPARDTLSGAAVVLRLPHESLLPSRSRRAAFVAIALRMADAPIEGTVPIVDAGDAERAYVAVVETRRPQIAFATLAEHPGGLPAIALALARSVAPTMDRAHAAGLVHGCLGVRHWLIVHGKIAVRGIGLAEAFDRRELVRLVAHDPCVAPEVREGQPAGLKADVFSLAASLAGLCAGGAGWSTGLAHAHPRVWQALAPALSLDAGARPNSCGELFAAFEAAVSPRRVARGTAPPSIRSMGSASLRDLDGDEPMTITPRPSTPPIHPHVVARARDRR